MKNLGNKSNVIFIFVLFIILSLILIISNFLLSFSLFPVYTDPLISSNNIRGTIYDRHGNPLALDKSSSGIKLLDSTRKEEAAAFLSEVLNRPALVISSLIDDGVTFFPLENTKSDDVKKIENMISSNMSGVLSLGVENTRVYPYSYLLSILGKKGEGGIETKYNDYLEAEPLLGVRTSYGEDIVLTLDKDIEETLYSALSEVNNPGTAFILNRKGEILAYYGRIDDTVLSSLVYSHSSKTTTTLFMRENIITINECTEIYPYYIHVDSPEILEIIIEALREEGRTN